MEPCAGFRQLCPSPSFQRPGYRDALINCTTGMRGMNCYVKPQLYCMSWRRKGQLPGVRTVIIIIMKNSVAKSMMGFWAISDRVIMMKLEAKPFNINVMQVYAPTQDHDDEEIEQFYQEIQNGIKYTKSDEVICIMWDLNAKVGDERYQNIVGRHGLGRRNERGQRLIQFCQENKLIIANTWFQQPVRKLYISLKIWPRQKDLELASC